MVTCDITRRKSGTAERDPDIVFRWTDANNFWLVRVTSAGNALELAEMAGGVYTVHVSQSYAFAAGTSYSLKVIASGTTITVYVNGVQQISYGNATTDLSATKVGLFLGAANAMSATCTWDNFMVSAVGGTYLWAQQDADYNVTALLNNSGAVVERYAYDPFGARTIYDANWNVRGASSFSLTYGYQGRPHYTISGDINFRNRIDSPTLGRPLQQDPISFAGGTTNLYQWEGDNPVGGLDPSGMSWLSRQYDKVAWWASPLIDEPQEIARGENYLDGATFGWAMFLSRFGYA